MSNATPAPATAADNSNNVNKLLAEFISETVAKPPEEQANSKSLLANLVKNLGDPNETNEEKEKFIASANQVADSVYPSLIREIIENSKKNDDAGKNGDEKSEGQVSPDIQDKVDQVNAVLDEGLERHFRNELDNDSILNIVKKAIEKGDESEPKPELTPLELDLIKNRLRNLINNIKPKILELYEKSKQEEAEKKKGDDKKPEEPAAPSPDQVEQDKPKEETPEAKKEEPEIKPAQPEDIAKPKPEPASPEKKDSPNQEEAKSDAPANPEPNAKKEDKPAKDDSKKEEKGSDGKEVAKKDKNGDEPTVIKLVLRIFIKGLDTSKFKPVVSVSSPSKSEVAPKKPSSSDKSSSSHKKHRDSSDKPKESVNKDEKSSKPKEHSKSSSSGKSGDDSKSKRSCKVEQKPAPVVEKKKSCEKKPSEKKSESSAKNESSSSSQKRSSRAAVPAQLPKEYLNIIYSQFDQDKDNYVSADDLAKTLANVYSLPKFDQEAAEALVNKYDQNKDSKIDASEFFPLFEGIGALHKEFVDTDYANDANGLLDAKELAQVFKKRGRKDEQLSAELFHWIILEVSKQPDGKTVPTYGLKFDKFVRVVEQFDELVKQFKQSENK